MKKKIGLGFLLALILTVGILAVNSRKTLFLKCPEPIQISDFNPALYSGRWYEVAYKDVAQFQICKCFKFDFTLKGERLFDFDYAAACPSSKGYSDYPVHSSVHIDEKIPNLLHEYVAGTMFNNNIVKVYKKGDTYDRAIQFQCKEWMGLNLYIGFNLVTRNPVFNPAEYDEMLRDIEALGLAPYGGTREGLSLVKMEHCN